MQNATRILFNAYIAQLAALSAVPSAAQTFTVAPTVQQTLEKKIQETSAFLKLINILGVTAQTGQKVGIGVSGPIASRTNTSSGDRTPRVMDTSDGTGYACVQTNYDTAIKYAKLDAWAAFPEFQTMVRDAIIQQQALDRIMIGWNGTSAAAATNLGSNPLLQDVNIGWLQQIRTNAPARVMDHGATTGHLKVGAVANNGDYLNLDALVFDLASTLLDPWYAEDPNLVVLCGRALMNDKLFPLVGGQDAPTEMLAADIVRSQRRLGGLPAMTVPYFPAGKLLVTRLDNLSIYYQTTSRRRSVIDNPKRDQIENFESSNDAYVVEDFGCVALAENIELV